MRKRNAVRAAAAALAAMMALTLLTGCGGKVTERAMEKAYGDYLRGQMGKPDMKVTYDVSPAVFEKIDADFRANKAQWFNGTYLASYNAGEYFYVPWSTGTAGAGVVMLKDALEEYKNSVSVHFYAAKMPESAGNAITQASYVLPRRRESLYQLFFGLDERKGGRPPCAGRR